MKKIAIFQKELNIGGTETSLINLLNNIDYTKNEVDLYLFESKNELINDINKNVKIFFLEKVPSIYKNKPFFFFNKYKGRIKKQYDLAINYTTICKDTILECIKTPAKKRILWIHTDIDLLMKESHRKRKLIKLLNNKYSFYDKFVMVSNGIYNSFPKKWLLNKDYAIIPNILDTKKIDEKLKEPTDINIDKKLLNIVCVARLDPVKQIDIIIKYLYELKKVRTDFHFYIIGDGPERKKLEKLTTKYNLNDNISFLGYRKNPYAIMKDMDAFVLPSRYEGQGIVFLEAAYLGLDIIMPKHLEDFVGINIKGSDNILRSLMNLKKKKKKEKYNLDNYNKEIIDKFNNLLTELEV